MSRSFSLPQGTLHECKRHKQHKCPVVPGDVHYYGFSCKSASRANNAVPPDVKKSMLSDDSSSTTTGDTYRCGILYLRKNKPAFIIWENVDTLADNESAPDSNINTLIKDLYEEGYVITIVKLNAMHYALPQRRLRLVILGIRMVMEHFGLELDVAECNAVLAKAQRSLSSMKRQPPSLLDIMLKDTDTHVKNHLQNFKIEPQDWCAKAAQSGWPELHMDTMQKHGMRWGDVQPDQETKDSPWYQN